MWLYLSTNMVHIHLILDNLRSSANVGSILRSADSFGVERVVACGSTPYPRIKNDPRDPVVINRNSRSIARSALGAELTVPIEHQEGSVGVIERYRRKGWTIIGLEQAPNSTPLHRDLKLPSQIVLIVGSETQGLSKEVLATCDRVVEIDQLGSKESLNVAVATGIALFRLRWPTG